MADHKLVSHDEWIAARKQFLTKEKEFTRVRDRLSQERRELPWERVDKTYVFEGSEGNETLPQLFDGRSQLIVYHFMFGPDWDAGCPHCSRWADNFDSVIVHLNHRDVSMIAVSRAPWRGAAWNLASPARFRWASAILPTTASIGVVVAGSSSSICAPKWGGCSCLGAVFSTTPMLAPFMHALVGIVTLAKRKTADFLTRIR